MRMLLQSVPSNTCKTHPVNLTFCPSYSSGVRESRLKVIPVSPPWPLHQPFPLSSAALLLLLGQPLGLCCLGLLLGFAGFLPGFDLLHLSPRDLRRLLCLRQLTETAVSAR